MLADPGFDTLPALVEANRRLLNSNDVRIGGIALGELRQRARGEVGAPSDGPLLLAGHQPELSHPGVWVKNFALSGLARKLHGTPLNLIVDNDTVKSTSLRVPAFATDPASVHLEQVRFDAMAGEVPYESREVVDPDLFRTFPERVGAIAGNWGFEPLLSQVWRDGRNIGELFSAMRQECEQAWGCENRELTVSRLSQTEAFRIFAGHILADLPRFGACYNAAIRDYRRRNRVRSANHPAPELAPSEAPFWVQGGGRRERATADSDVCQLRPRALTLTLFARLCLGDFFIHGIGGGKYDEATDAIIRDYFGVEPPAYQVLSATLHLPLPGFPGTADDVRRLRGLIRDLHWNPQRHLNGANRSDAHALRQAADRIDLAADEPPRTDRRGRREWFHRLREMAAALRPLVQSDVPVAEAALERAEAEASANAILQRRDYSWVLFPESVVRPFLQRFLIQ
ncbi:MAG TPA: hypothetical protein VGI99_14600 [Gemmataceae bacterium]